MGVDDFAKYVILNMSRATLANAFNISSKIYGDKAQYDTVEFLHSVDSYVRYALVNNKIDDMQAYKILIATDKCLNRFDEESNGIKYNKQMVVDDFITEVWECYQ